MKKIAIIEQLGILILFFVFLRRFIWAEEIILLYMIPLILVFFVSGFITIVVSFFRKINYRKFLNRTFIVSFIVQLILFGLIVLSIYPRTYSKKQVVNDIDKAVALMEDIHPNLYNVINKDEFALNIDSVKSAIPLKVTEPELYKVFANITSKISDGHTGLDFKNFLNRGSIFFRKVPPYTFKIKDNKVYVLKNYYKRNYIPVGSEVLTINNKPAKQCLDEISSLISFETITYRDALLQLPIFWGLWNNFNDFDITYKTPGNNTVSITTSSGLISNFNYLWDMSAGFGFQSYSFEILEGNIAYINIKAFEDLAKFKSFARSAFGIIKQNEIDNLIIDLRENGGGASSVSEELMQYISPVEYNSFDTSLIKVSNYLINRYSLDTENYILGSLKDENRQKIMLQNNPLRFNGKSYVLTSGYCYSTALDFAAMVRCFKAGILIGSETGGRTKSFGSPIKVTLPETGIKLKISCKKFVNVCAIESSKGLIPDHIIENSIDDDIKNKDSVLEYTLQLIKEK